MHLEIRAPFEMPQHIDVAAVSGRSLGMWLGVHAETVTQVMANGVFLDEWSTYEPGDADNLLIFLETGVITGAMIVQAVIYAIVAFAISTALNYLLAALTSSAANPQDQGKTENIYGIAGLTNTTALGTPRLLCYGTYRVYGHIIGTRTDVSADGKQTEFGILYFMGDGPIEGLSDVQVNDVAVEQYVGITVDTRLGGADNDTVIPGFENIRDVWADGRPMALATFIVYQTKTPVDNVTVIFSTPYLFKLNGSGAKVAATHNIIVEYSVLDPVNYVTAPGSTLHWTDLAETTRFRAFGITFPATDTYLIRVILASTDNEQDAVPVLYNVDEERNGTYTYPGSSLLALRGIASSQITSFEGMRGSALVTGRKVKRPLVIDDVWDGVTYETVHTNQRAWIIRDVLTNPTTGLGNYIDESLWDDDAAAIAQNYWNVEEAGIPRDTCNVILNQRQAGWDWLKILCAEGRACLLTTDGRFKLVVDQAGDPEQIFAAYGAPGLPYVSPGNILAGTLKASEGDGQTARLLNRLQFQFPDETEDYKLSAIELVAEGAEAEPSRDQIVTFYTLTDTTHAYWLAHYQLLRQRLVQRHWSWVSPQTALVSEPLDIVALSYETVDMRRGASGFVYAGSTGSRLLLGTLVTLQSSMAYVMILRHQATNATEYRPVATGAGIVGALETAVAFEVAPVEGDIWVVGPLDNGIQSVQIATVALNAEGNFEMTADEYQPNIYAFPLPPEVV